jgi:outer membrane receptor protein involved in Fe transport
LGSKKTITGLGGGFRFDDVKDIELSHVKKRQFINAVQKGDVKETNAFIYWDQQLELTNQLSVNAGIRYDHFRFGYKNQLLGENNFRYQTGGIVSPKLIIGYSPKSSIKLFLSNGIGFHSNDARVILSNEAKNILPGVYGTDLGLSLKPVKNLLLKATAWHLYSEQEFVYVGDVGIVEPSGKTRRMGIDISARYQLNSWLYADVDLNLTKARAIGENKNEDYVPLSPSFTSIGGLSTKFKNGFSGSLRYRLIDDRPANKTYSVTAEGYFLTDAVLRYRLKTFEITASVENIFNKKWKEAQFDTRSKLQSEPDPVSEIHYTAGSTRFLKLGIQFDF